MRFAILVASKERPVKQLVLHYPDDLADAVQLTEEELEQQVRLMAALKMFELGKLSSGKAAELAGLSRAAFLDACGRYQVAVYNVAPDELRAELESDAKVARGDRP